MRISAIVSHACALVPLAFTNAAEIRVPSDVPTIQGAIAAAVSGDVILVAPGTYAENINYLGKNIRIESEQGPDVTIISG